MLAFMGAQAFVMMYQAGEGWQYGKRKQSAMTNEEFNKQTPQSIMEKQAVVLQSALGTIEKSMNSMTPMVGTIVSQYGDFVKEIIRVLPQIAQNIGADPNAQQLALSGSGLAGLIANEIKKLIPSIPEAEARIGPRNVVVTPLPTIVKKTPKIIPKKIIVPPSPSLAQLEHEVHEMKQNLFTIEKKIQAARPNLQRLYEIYQKFLAYARSFRTASTLKSRAAAKLLPHEQRYRKQKMLLQGYEIQKKALLRTIAKFQIQIRLKVRQR